MKEGEGSLFDIMNCGGGGGGSYSWRALFRGGNKDTFSGKDGIQVKTFYKSHVANAM